METGNLTEKLFRAMTLVKCLDSITDSTDMNLNKLREIVEDRGAWHTVVHQVMKSWTRLSDWPAMMLKMIQDIRKRMEVHTEKTQEMFNREREDLKNRDEQQLEWKIYYKESVAEYMRQKKEKVSQLS